MFKKLINKKHVKNEKGLTLIELLAVIVILAIISAIAIPAIGNIIDSSRVKAAKADAANILNSANIYFTENPSATTFDNLTKDGSGSDEIYKSYIADLGTIKTFTVEKSNGVITIAATGESNNKGYTITKTTLKELKIEDGKPGGKFTWSTGS
ncbi:prepilin-type N-terminal cleavage/methylation domain-containing protein [Lysinibacillus sphaericus]|uniref:Prepilin-type N-terminal cleavage/methylation domain-containing protein n=1 Tax=Lysinibacillus sphaericus OT4b.31 TaxID=1285586 RepID=R7ZFW7_LYSSH|nr:prepilin-type N-terminal cleavage/methylation domain-containing protein [Lysinibacillus sphaericus]EON73010.1 hypothetical protein H131_08253 [Lysinibacillus sphaericus OT4b.31]